MPENQSAVRVQDGSWDFSFGVDSSRVTTVASQTTPQGLPRNSLAWGDNITVRGGGIQQRNGWLKLFLAAAQGSGNYQGGFLYVPTDGTTPYLMLSIGGVIWQCLLDGSNTVTNLSAMFNMFNPASPTQIWMEQAEEFLIIQAGDFFTASTPTLPLFWDGATLRRSNGLAPPIPGISQYVLTLTTGWVVPAVGQSTPAVPISPNTSPLPVTLAAPYPGSNGDQITWGNYGVFTVSGKSGNTIVLTTVSTSLAGATVAPASYSVTAVGIPQVVPYNVTLVNSWSGLSTSKAAVLQLSVTYTGHAGDVVTWAGQGTFTVMGLVTTVNPNDTILALSDVPRSYPTGAGQIWTAQPPAAASTNYAAKVHVNNTQNLGLGYPGTQFVVHLSAPYAGPGIAGDTIFWWYGAPQSKNAMFTSTIVSVTNGGLTLTLSVVEIAGIVTNPPGFTLSAGNYSWVEVAAPMPPTPPVTPLTAELPAATCMKYYSGILWYAQGTKYTGGDIVLSASGTLSYGFRDAVLKVTENQLAVVNQGFSVPSQSRNITALFFTANLNTSLGQGPLYIGTRKAVYQLTVPSTLVDWTNANNANQPVQTVAQFKYGPVGDRCVALVNGDAFYQTLEPAVRSFQVSQRYFGQWANVPISNNENRVLRFNNRALMPTASGIDFDNRLLETVLPFQSPVGVAFQGIIPLDFDLISTLQEQRPPAWEGMLEGINVLQLFEADFNGLQRAFALAWSDPNNSGDGGIYVWELTSDSAPSQRDDADSRVSWYFESPAWTCSDEFALKELDWLQLWLDRIAGKIDLTVQYRTDADNCWRFWAQTSFCAARNSCEDLVNPVCYPEQPYCEGQKFPIGLPKPPALDCVNQNQRPTNIGFQFQLRVTIKGWCRVRGLLLRALPKNQETFANITC